MALPFDGHRALINGLRARGNSDRPELENNSTLYFIGAVLTWTFYCLE